MSLPGYEVNERARPLAGCRINQSADEIFRLPIQLDEYSRRPSSHPSNHGADDDTCSRLVVGVLTHKCLGAQRMWHNVHCRIVATGKRLHAVSSRLKLDCVTTPDPNWPASWRSF